MKTFNHYTRRLLLLIASWDVTRLLGPVARLWRKFLRQLRSQASGSARLITADPDSSQAIGTIIAIWVYFAVFIMILAGQ